MFLIKHSKLDVCDNILFLALGVCFNRNYIKINN